MDEEFKGLPEVLTGVSDFSVSFCIESAFHLLEESGCSDFLKFAASTHKFPLALEIHAKEKSKNVRAVKLNFYKQICATFEREHARLVAQKQLLQVGVHLILRLSLLFLAHFLMVFYFFTD